MIRFGVLVGRNPDPTSKTFQLFTTPGKALVPFWPDSQWQAPNLSRQQAEEGFPFVTADELLLDANASNPGAGRYIDALVYGFGFAAVDKDPVVAQVPDFGDRFWVYSIYDARSDEFSNLGKQYGTRPGFYLIVGPNWKGETPSGITTVLHAPTDLIGMAPRIFMDDTPEDRQAIQPVINQVLLYPLSKYTGEMQTKDWKKAPSFGPSAQGGEETRWVIPETFFDELPDVLNEIPPLPGEETLYANIHSLLDAAAKNPDIKATLKQVAIDTEVSLITPLFSFANNGVPVGNGWTTPANGARFGYDYLTRAATAKSNMYVNQRTIAPRVRKLLASATSG